MKCECGLRPKFCSALEVEYEEAVKVISWAAKLIACFISTSSPSHTPAEDAQDPSKIHNDDINRPLNSVQKDTEDKKLKEEGKHNISGSEELDTFSAVSSAEKKTGLFGFIWKWDGMEKSWEVTWVTLRHICHLILWFIMSTLGAEWHQDTCGNTDLERAVLASDQTPS